MPKLEMMAGGKKAGREPGPELKKFIADYAGELRARGVDPSNVGDRAKIRDVMERFLANPNLKVEDLEDLGPKAVSVLEVLQGMGGPEGPGPSAPAAMLRKPRGEEGPDHRMAA